ncbi:MAG: hypothetical protein JWL77_3587 [Chthonomonadaceae bacterium]|nr:hypothetical protein [Chthonomonadaceae bacterium]
MSSSILASALLSGGDDPASAVVVTSPLAGVPYNLDIAWGVAGGDPPAVISTMLTCPGAAIDTAYGPAIRGHGVPVSRPGVDLGWSPSGKSVYLTPSQAALGLWRLTFPTAGTYTVTLSGLGTLGFTVVGSAPVVTSPMVMVLHPSPLNRQPSKLLQLTYQGTYPTGGLDLPADRIGLRGILFADLNDDATYRYTWSGGKLRAWTGSGEASGTVSLATVGLFFGMVG